MNHGLTGDQVLALAIGLYALYRFVKWRIHMRRHPDVTKCRCKGSGVIMSRNILRRRVKGTCPDCKGSPWLTRRI